MAQAPRTQTVRQRVTRSLLILLLIAALLAAALLWLFKGFLGSDMRQAQIALVDGDFDRAETLFRRVLEKEPQNSEALLGLGYLSVEQGAWDPAIDFLDRAAVLSPNLAEVYIQRGRARHQRTLTQDKHWRYIAGFERAFDDYDRAIELKPNDARPWLGRGMCRICLEQYRESIADLDQGLKLYPQSAQGLERKAYALFKLGRYDEALENVNKSAELNSRSPAMWNTRGHIHLQRGEYQQAHQDFSRAIRYDPLNTKYYCFRGYAWNCLARYDDALADFQRAKQIDPEDMAGYHNCAITYCLQGQRERALQEIQTALQIDPQNEQTYKSRAVVFEKLNQLDDAREDYKTAMQINPEYIEALQALARLDIAEGKLQSAGEKLLKLSEEDPDDFATYRHLGYVYLLRDDPDEAMRQFQQALDRMPIDFTSNLRRYIILSQRGEQDARAELRNLRETWVAIEWPKPIVLMFLDEITPEELLKETIHPSPSKQAERQCEAWHTIGIWRELHGDTAAARQAYQNSVDANTLALPVRQLSLHALQTLDSPAGLVNADSE
ncbi:tetratricopeptide repeat protein [Candidatus Sumerlaeota bacterium]|nr:tetratricopeptide repeat protein [Candidatus Sumerlaeota bacterium]